MAYPAVHKPSQAASVWAIARRQHGVIARSQLLEIGLHPQAIKHRVASGRLHRVQRCVYAVGRPELTRRGQWMAAVLSCGPRAALSHATAAALWEMRPERGGRSEPIEVSVPANARPRRSGMRVHRRRRLPPADVTRRDGIPVTSPVRTLIDLAARLPAAQLEAVINAADKRDLIDSETLRAVLEQRSTQRGVAALVKVLDRRTVRLTDSELERRFAPLAARAGLSPPQTGRYVNGYKVDFFWPELGLVVETDGLRYHRTPAQQARDRERDQAHAMAGLTPLRFTHHHVTFEPGRVVAALTAVAELLAAGT
jgi:very-short-patch-repair endonuclease